MFGRHEGAAEFALLGIRALSRKAAKRRESVLRTGDGTGVHRDRLQPRWYHQSTINRRASERRSKMGSCPTIVAPGLGADFLNRFGSFSQALSASIYWR